MILRFLGVASLSLVASCTATSGSVSSAPMASPEPAEDEAPSPSGPFALVWFDAAFHRTPDDSEPVRAYDFSGDPRSERAGHFFTMRVLEDRGEWLRVTDPKEWIRQDGAPIHCVGSGAFWVEHFGIELWVRRTDLVPVLRRGFRRRYDDGTFLDLRPGTPVIGGRPWAKGYHFPVTVAEDAIALTYEPALEADSHESKTFSAVRAVDTRFSLGGAPVSWSRRITDYADVPLFKVNEDRTRSFERTGCGTFELAFQGRIREPDEEGGILGVMLADERVPGIEIAQGTPLYWPTGEPAGEVVRTFHQGGSTRGAGPRTCLRVPIGTDLRTTGFAGASVTVCVDSSTVRSVETRPPLPAELQSADNSVRIVE